MGGTKRKVEKRKTIEVGRGTESVKRKKENDQKTFRKNNREVLGKKNKTQPTILAEKKKGRKETSTAEKNGPFRKGGPNPPRKTPEFQVEEEEGE